MSILNKPLRVLLVTNGLILFAGAMLAPIYALYVERIGGDLFQASVLGAVYAFAAGITTIISGRYSDKIKENEMVVIYGYLTMSFGFLLYMLADSIVWLFVIQCVLGLGEAIYSPAFDSLYSKHLDKGKAGFEWGAWESMIYFVLAVAAVTGGVVVTKIGFEVMFIAMASLSLASALYLYSRPRKLL